MPLYNGIENGKAIDFSLFINSEKGFNKKVYLNQLKKIEEIGVVEILNQKTIYSRF